MVDVAVDVGAKIWMQPPMAGTVSIWKGVRLTGGLGVITRDLLNVEYSGILTQVITAFDPGAVGLPRSRSGTNAASDRARATPAPRWAGATFCLGVAGSHCPRATNCLGFPQRHEESRHLFFQGCFKLFQIGKIHSSTQTKQF